MHLAVGVAGADCTPAHQVAQVLRGDRVEPFRGRRQPHTHHIAQHLAGEPHAFANIELAVDVGIVDQALPANGGTGFLEVHAHDDEQIAFELIGELGQSGGVFMCGLRVVDRTGPHNGKHAVVTAMQNVADLRALLEHLLAHLLGERQLLDEIAWRGNRIELTNVHIDGLGHHRIGVKHRIL